MVLEECPAMQGGIKCPHCDRCTKDDQDCYYVISATGIMKDDLEKLTSQKEELTPGQEKYLARIKTTLTKMGML